MLSQLKNIKKIIFILFIIGLTGCFGGPEFVAQQGHGVKLEKSEVWWSRNFGPKISGDFRSVAVADFNNDGNLDLAGGSSIPGSVFIWTGDGLGNWKRLQRLQIRADIRSLATGDVNGDGWIDLISSSMGDTKGVQVWLNEKGTFGNMQPITEKEIYQGITLADINHDGILDVVAANSTGIEKGGIKLWLGDGKGNFNVETGPTRVEIYRDVAAGDFNNDGDIDLVGAGWLANLGTLRIWLGSGDGRWSGSKVATGSFWGVSAADVNKDGNLDIIAASNYDGVIIYYGDGSGGFPDKDVLASKGSFRKARALDIDKDGFMDVIATSNNNNGIVIWYQKGKKKWVAKDEGLPTDGFYFDFLPVDINRDGNIDIVSSVFGDGINVWYGAGYNPTIAKGTVRRKTKKTKIKEEKLVEKKTVVNQKPIAKRIINKEEIVEKKVVIIPEIDTSIFFDTLSADLKPGYKLILSKVAELLKKNKEITIKVEGHADPRKILGRKKKFSGNKSLSLARAEAVANFLISSGIEKERIKIFAYGTEKAVPYKQQRRVDIKQFGVEQRENDENIDEKKGRAKNKTLSKGNIIKEKMFIPEISTSVFFDPDISDVRPQSMVILNKVVEYMKKYKDITAKIKGHGDRRSGIGSNRVSENQALAESRAKEVANIFISSGIDEKRIKISANGNLESDKLDDNPDSFQALRRVDIITSSIEMMNILEVAAELDAGPNKNVKNNMDDRDDRTLAENASYAIDVTQDPFAEFGDIIPAVDYKSFKLVNGIAMYKIGAPDVLSIRLWEGLEEKKFLTPVTPSGNISFSFIEDYYIAGMTTMEAEIALTEELKKLIKIPKIKITVDSKRAYTASIFGAVRSLSRQPTGPGTYALKGRERITQFISRVGGYMDNADLTHVQLTRDRKTFVLNIFDALFKGDFRQDVLIDAGDLMFIPSLQERKKGIFVMGEVARPGMFQFKDKISLLEAIIQAGGPTFYGATEEVIVVRGDVTKPEAIKVNFKDIIEKGDFRNNMPLQNGDIVYITKNTIGNIREFLIKMSPVLDMARLPMDVYGATAFPTWDGFPIRRLPANPSTVISSPPSLPSGTGVWGMGK